MLRNNRFDIHGELLVEKEISMEKESVFIFFADMREALDKPKGYGVWRIMTEIEVDEPIRTKIEEIYDETKCKVKIKGEHVGEFYTKK